MSARFVRFAALSAALGMITGCGAIKSSAIKSVADTLAAPDSDVFARDEDLELVAAAAPFGLKLYESLGLGSRSELRKRRNTRIDDLARQP